MDMRTKIKDRYPNIFLFIPRYRSTPHSCSSYKMKKKYSGQRKWKVSYVFRLQWHCAQLLLQLVSCHYLNLRVFSFTFPFLSPIPFGDNEQAAVWNLAVCWFNPQQGSLESRTIIHPVNLPAAVFKALQNSFPSPKFLWSLIHLICTVISFWLEAFLLIESRIAIKYLICNTDVYPSHSQWSIKSFSITKIVISFARVERLRHKQLLTLSNKAYRSV